MLFCSNCGKELQPGSKFCNECGTPVFNKENIIENVNNTTLTKSDIDETTNIENTTLPSEQECLNNQEKSNDNSQSTSNIENSSPIKKEISLFSKKSLILIIVLIFGAISALVFKASTETIGDFKNFTKIETVKALEEKGFTNVKVRLEPSDDIPKGNVIRLSVSPDTKVKSIENNDLVIYISDGKYRTVFDWAGMTPSEAKDKFKELGFTNVTIKKELHETANVGEIISCNVKAGNNISVDEKIVILECSGVGVNIPDVTRLEESVAKRKIEALGITCKIVYDYTSEINLGSDKPLVISQSAKGMVSKSSNSSITLTVCKPSVNITNLLFGLNSVGGLDLRITYKNLSNKDVKYIYVYFTIKNAVGDKIECRIRGYDYPRLIYTGPLAPNKSDTVDFDAVVYNNTISEVHVDKVVVDFMDGTSQTLPSYWYWRKA